MTEQEAIEIVCAYGVPMDEEKFKEALELAINALEKQEQYKSLLGKHMRVYYDDEEPKFGHSIMIRVDYTDLLKCNEYDFAKGLYEAFLRYYQQANRESDD